jgi:hypothetical protein
MAKINLRKIEDLGVEEGYSSKLFTKLVNDILLLLGIHAEANKLFIESWMQDISQAWEGFDYDDA